MSVSGRIIRGIRDSITSGLIGRASSGSGPAELIPWSAIASAVAAVQRGKAATNSTGAILPANPVQEDFVPAGGTTGQVLTKASDSDFDADWEDAASGSGDVVGPASATNNHVVFFDGTTGKLIKDSGLTLSGSNTGDQTLPVGANPTATATDTAVNGTATTFMRSDGAPAVQKGSSTAFGIVKVDGTTITATGGVISAVSGGSGTVTTTGTPTTGSLTKFSGSTSIANADLTGDITTSGGLTTTLATVNANVGTFGSSAVVPVITVNAKGLTTAVTTAAISGTVPGSGGLIGKQIFTSGTGTYTPTPGTGSIIIEMVGGGGGAAGLASQSSGTTATGQSGGGGAYLLKRLTSNFNGGTYSVGSGGNGGAAGNNAGNNGGDTTFTDTASNVYTAGGGLLGSIAGTSAAPRIGGSTAGGTATGGDVNVPGGASGVTMALSASALVGAYGGASRFSFGGLPNRQTANPGSTVGNDAGGFGGGGSVGLMIGSGTAVRGGNGSGGIIIIWEYS